MSRKLGFQIAAMLFGLQGLCLILAATFFGANAAFVGVGALNFIVGTLFLQMSFRSPTSDDSVKDEQEQPLE